MTHITFFSEECFEPFGLVTLQTKNVTLEQGQENIPPEEMQRASAKYEETKYTLCNVRLSHKWVRLHIGDGNMRNLDTPS